MKRRLFINNLGLSGIIFLTPLWGCFKDSSATLEKVLNSNELRKVMSDSDIQKIGESYLEIVPVENNIDVLKTLIIQTSVTNSIDIVNNVKLKIKNDFIISDVIVVSNWVLSVTEARICALTYLINR